MDKKLAKQLVDAHRKTAELYNEAANRACESGGPFEVYHLMKLMIAEEGKIRALENRYLRGELGA
jgi:hypothetical protein